MDGIVKSATNIKELAHDDVLNNPVTILAHDDVLNNQFYVTKIMLFVSDINNPKVIL